MPLYRIVSEPGALTPAQKAAIAEGVVELHLRLAGGARAFVNVLFETFAAGDLYVGGKPAPRMLMSASVRTGRTQETKAALLTGFSALVSRIAGVPEAELLISIGEVRPENAMEAGHILPQVGEEEAWLRKVGHHAAA